MAKLSPKQLAFCQEYILCRNGTEAARKAGYKGNDRTLCVIGSENLAKPDVIAFLLENEKKVESKFELTQEKILRELAIVAFGSLANVATWNEEDLTLIPSSDLKYEDLQFVESIQSTTKSYGMGNDKTDITELSIKTLSSQKVPALKLLGQHVGLWSKINDKGNGNESNPRDPKIVLGRLSELLRNRKK